MPTPARGHGTQLDYFGPGRSVGLQARHHSPRRAADRVVVAQHPVLADEVGVEVGDDQVVGRPAPRRARCRSPRPGRWACAAPRRISTAAIGSSRRPRPRTGGRRWFGSGRPPFRCGSAARRGGPSFSAPACRPTRRCRGPGRARGRRRGSSRSPAARFGRDRRAGSQAVDWQLLERGWRPDRCTAT